MAIDVPVTTVIARPREAVASFAMDPTNDTRWIGGIKKVDWLTEPPLRVGSRIQRLAKFLGRSIDYVLEVADLTPGREVVMKSVKAPFPMTVTYSFRDAPGGTEAGVRVQGGSGIVFALAGPLMASQVRRSLRGDLRRLKAISESR